MCAFWGISGEPRNLGSADAGKQYGLDEGKPALTGVVPLEKRRWKAVWVRSDKGDDPWLRGDFGHLCGIDSERGAGERVLVEGPESIVRPLLCPDGKTVVYSRREHGTGDDDSFGFRIFATDWDDPNPRELGDGIGLQVKRDDLDGRIWVYAGVEFQNREAVSANRLIRFPLDDPASVEEVWDAARVSVDNIQFSADGSKFVATFPWPDGGIADVRTGRWQQSEEGCWPSLAPGDSGVSWVFDGHHRNLQILPPGREPYTIRINTGQGMDGYEVYHPRWTNDAAFFTCTGPYLKGTGGMRIGEGGNGVEVYIGQFDPTLSEVVAWHQVTDNEFADFYPDVWVEGGEETRIEPENMRAARRLAGGDPGLHESWPGAESGLIFQWENRRKATGMVDGHQRSFQMLAKGRARFGPHGEMLTRGGYFICADGVGAEIASAVRSADGFTVEALITPHSTQQVGARNILSLSRNATDRNFLLAQSGSGLSVWMRSMKSCEAAEKSRFDFGELEEGRTYHVLISGGVGTLDCYLDGELYQSKRGLFDGFGSWIPHELIVGDEWGGDRNWDGGIEAVAMFRREVDAEEARHHYELATKMIQGREPVPRASVVGRLIKAGEIPSLAGLGAYRRHLSAYVYAVEHVFEGDADLGGRRIVAYHWTVMDKEPSTGYPRKEGMSYSLLLEPLAAHAQLAQESKDDVEDIELIGAPMYLDVGS